MMEKLQQIWNFFDQNCHLFDINLFVFHKHRLQLSNARARIGNRFYKILFQNGWLSRQTPQKRERRSIKDWPISPIIAQFERRSTWNHLEALQRENGSTHIHHLFASHHFDCQPKCKFHPFSVVLLSSNLKRKNYWYIAKKRRIENKPTIFIT